MAKVAFKHYLHDSYGKYELAELLQEQTGLTFTEEQLDDLGRPFYEVTLHCLLDTDIMKVTIIGAE